MFATTAINIPIPAMEKEIAPLDAKCAKEKVIASASAIPEIKATKYNPFVPKIIISSLDKKKLDRD